MPLLCPDCAQAALQLGPTVELPADHESDEITIEVLRCPECALLALGLAEESHRGSSDDAWRHGGWRRTEREVARVESLMAVCPQPSLRTCGCESHRALAALKDDLRRDQARFTVRFAKGVAAS